MDVIYFLIPLALLLLLAAIGAFLWAVKNDQFDNLDREAHRILFDEDLVKQRSRASGTAPSAAAPAAPAAPAVPGSAASSPTQD